MPRGSAALPSRLQGQRNRALLPLLLREELDKRELLPLETPEAEGPWEVDIVHLSQRTRLGYFGEGSEILGGFERTAACDGHCLQGISQAGISG